MKRDELYRKLQQLDNLHEYTVINLPSFILERGSFELGERTYTNPDYMSEKAIISKKLVGPCKEDDVCGVEKHNQLMTELDEKWGASKFVTEKIIKISL